MGRIFFAVLFAVLLVAGCVQQQPQGPPTGQPKQLITPSIIENGQAKPILPGSSAGGGVDYTYYSSPVFLLYYPRGWAAEEVGNGQFAFTAPVEGDPEKNVADQLIVEIWAGEESTPEAYANYEAEFMVEGDRVTGGGAITFKDRAAFVIEVEGPNERTGKPMFYQTVFFRNGKWVYRLQYSMEKARQEKVQPLFEDMLDRFVVGNYQG
ncbi:MAG: hypothetical protein J4203_01945 [Candidatus Diapherotrites archaeon]|uniref:Uncharacterized protein n=2 Tax=Candidatus Iainarchaeum sp. TaxID=3101447 RepID=A0A8T4LAK2_9ARCH|nr:hypothetical protein [Candidatus Diapherotrites archaeon]